MQVRGTRRDRTPTGRTLPPTYVNTVTHWWDGSQIYGSDGGAQPQAAHRRGRQDRSWRTACLPNEADPAADGIDLTGFSDNWWVGLSLLHTLFVKEHNAICDYLKGHYPTWDDERLFHTARLVNSALMAKIHTVEWTPGDPRHPVLERAMHANWYGVAAGEGAAGASAALGDRRLFGGIVGSRPGAPQLRRTRSPRSSSRSTGCTR